MGEHVDKGERVFARRWTGVCKGGVVSRMSYYKGTQSTE
jgi:hypothetical protein